MAEGRRLSGAQQGAENVARLQKYVATLKAAGRPLPAVRGKLNLTAIAKACGFDRGVFYDNVAAAAVVDEAAAELGIEGIAHRLETAPIREEDDLVRSLRERIRRLEQDKAALTAEVQGLRARLRRTEHLEEHMVETGWLPR